MGYKLQGHVSTVLAPLQSEVKLIKLNPAMIFEFISKHKKIIISIFLVFLWAIFGYLLFSSFVKPLYQDEGVFLAIGKGVAAGNLPYLDFWDHKTPGIYFLWAALFPVFGTKVIFYKILIWVVNLLTAFLVFRISEKIKESSGKFASIFFLCSLVFFQGNYLIAGSFLAFFLTLAAWFMIVLEQKKWSYFLAGISISLAVIFKQTAVFSLFAAIIYLVSMRDLRKIFHFLAGLILPFVGLFTYLKQNELIEEFKHQVIVSSSNYPSDRLRTVLVSLAKTMSRVWWLWFGVIASFFDYEKFSKEKMLIILMAFLPIVTFFVRDYPHYWLQILPFLAILAGIGFGHFFEKVFTTSCNIFAIAIILAIIVTFCGSTMWFGWVTDNYNQPKAVEEILITKKLTELPATKILTENRYTGFYFLADQISLNKYLYLTEVNEGEQARAKTLSDLQNGHDIVILWPKDQTYVYAKEIGDWLAANTEVAAEFSAFEMIIYYKD